MIIWTILLEQQAVVPLGWISVPSAPTIFRAGMRTHAIRKVVVAVASAF
jgi:hypothetical protein